MNQPGLWFDDRIILSAAKPDLIKTWPIKSLRHCRSEGCASEKIVVYKLMMRWIVKKENILYNLCAQWPGS